MCVTALPTGSGVADRILNHPRPTFVAKTALQPQIAQLELLASVEPPPNLSPELLSDIDHEPGSLPALLGLPARFPFLYAWFPSTSIPKAPDFPSLATN